MSEERVAEHYHTTTVIIFIIIIRNSIIIISRSGVGGIAASHNQPLARRSSRILYNNVWIYRVFYFIYLENETVRHSAVKQV